MSRFGRTDRALVYTKGEARPLAEPKVRLRKTRKARRVGASLPTELYVRFKAYVARRGVTGEEAIITAIEALITQV